MQLHRRCTTPSRSPVNPRGTSINLTSQQVWEGFPYKTLNTIVFSPQTESSVLTEVEKDEYVRVSHVGNGTLVERVVEYPPYSVLSVDEGGGVRLQNFISASADGDPLNVCLTDYHTSPLREGQNVRAAEQELR